MMGLYDRGGRVELLRRVTSREAEEENARLYDLQVVKGGFCAACFCLFSPHEGEGAKKSNSDQTDLYQSPDRPR